MFVLSHVGSGVGLELVPQHWVMVTRLSGAGNQHFCNLLVRIETKILYLIDF